MSVKEYVNKFRDFIKQRLNGSKLLPSIVMAHALHESADDNEFVGRGVHTVQYNNDVRVRADRKWKGPRVQLPIRSLSRFARGRKAWFRIYQSGQDALGDRIDMLVRKHPSWTTAFFYNDTLRIQAEILQSAVQPNDPRYGERMVAIIKRHKLYRMDNHWIIETALTSLITFAIVLLASYLLSFWDAFVPWR